MYRDEITKDMEVNEMAAYSLGRAKALSDYKERLVSGINNLPEYQIEGFEIARNDLKVNYAILKADVLEFIKKGN